MVLRPPIMTYESRNYLHESFRWIAKLYQVEGGKHACLPIGFFGSTEDEARDKASRWFDAEAAKMAVSIGRKGRRPQAAIEALAKIRAAKRAAQ